MSLISLQSSPDKKGLDVHRGDYVKGRWTGRDAGAEGIVQFLGKGGKNGRPWLELSTLDTDVGYIRMFFLDEVEKVV